MIIRKPELCHYPEWLRPLIPDNSFMREVAPPLGVYTDNMKDLQSMFNQSRANPVYRLIVILIVELIRKDFQMYSLQRQIVEIHEELRSGGR